MVANGLNFYVQRWAGDYEGNTGLKRPEDGRQMLLHIPRDFPSHLEVVSVQAAFSPSLAADSE